MGAQGCTATLVAATLAISRSSLYYRKQVRGSRALAASSGASQERVAPRGSDRTESDLAVGYDQDLGGASGRLGVSGEFDPLLYEMICADFLAGVSLETGNQDALLSALTRLVLGLPMPQREQLLESVQVVS
jgi:hypothetical protein